MSRSNDIGGLPGRQLYTVRFDGCDLWGARAGADDVVFVDLFDDYVEPAR